MRKVFLLFLSILLLIAVSLSAQKKTEVLLKFSKQEGIMRIVFEAEGTLINNAKITASTSQIKIEFSEPFTITAKKDLPFEVVIKDKFLVVNLKEKSEVKFFRLSSPSRVVFDILKQEVQTEKQPLTIPFKVFTIDPGHGGYDFGIIYGDVSEKDIGLSLAKDLYAVLSKKGKRVFLTRKVDQYVSLADRINLVNQKSPDVFISLHSSMSENFVLYNPKFEEQGSDEIADLYSLLSRQKNYIEKSRAFSVSIEKAIEDEFKVDVIRREMSLPILNSAGAPSVLIEFPSPRFLVYDQQMRVRLINSIINGIVLYEE
ncbi:MAG: N-acetylmuramoyl-L-alanine amidase [Nitrospirota bacterium]